MAAMTASAGLPLWSDYVRFTRRHVVAIAVLVCLGALIGFAWSLQQPTTYSATASVVLAPVPKYVTVSTSEVAPPEVSIDTDAQLLYSPRVLGAIAGALGRGADAEDAIDHLSVSAAPNSHLLRVTISAASPQAAADAADAAVAALIEVRRQTLGALRLDQLDQLRLQIERQQEMLGGDQVLAAYDDVSAQVLRLNAGLQELKEARRRPADATNPAQPPRHADRADTEVPVTSGVMVGLLCACLLGAGRDRLEPQRFPRKHNPTSSPPLCEQPPARANRHEDYRHVV